MFKHDLEKGKKLLNLNYFNNENDEAYLNYFKTIVFKEDFKNNFDNYVDEKLKDLKFKFKIKRIDMKEYQFNKIKLTEFKEKIKTFEEFEEFVKNRHLNFDIYNSFNNNRILTDFLNKSNNLNSEIDEDLKKEILKELDKVLNLQIVLTNDCSKKFIEDRLKLFGFDLFLTSEEKELLENNIISLQKIFDAVLEFDFLDCELLKLDLLTTKILNELSFLETKEDFISNLIGNIVLSWTEHLKKEKKKTIKNKIKQV